jgi:hypothetical protein
MSAFIGVAQTAEEALGAAAVETIIQLVAPANHRVRVLGWGVFFDSVSPTAEPVQVRLLRQSTAGSGTSLALVKLDDSLAETLQTTALQDFIFEPTAGDVLDVVEVHPQTGYEVKYPMGQEPIIGGGDRMGLDCTAPAIVNVRAKIFFEE